MSEKQFKDMMEASREASLEQMHRHNFKGNVDQFIRKFCNDKISTKNISDEFTEIYQKILARKK